jgi:hypothetical protein
MTGMGQELPSSRYSLDVRFTVNSDQTADIPEGPFRAEADSCAAAATAAIR